MNEDREHVETGVARRELLVMRAGGCAFGVFADEVEEVTKLRGACAPLPFAPPGVLGVTAVRGRMRTLIDPFYLLTRRDPQTPADSADASPSEPETTPADAHASPGLAVVLRGDEQLALAVARVERVVEITSHAITPSDPPLDFARGRVTHEPDDILILDPTRIFEAVMRGHTRRRVR